MEVIAAHIVLVVIIAIQDTTLVGLVERKYAVLDGPIQLQIA